MSELAKINGYDIRDKKLADEGTVTTASSTDYVLLEDTNGNYQKISKNSFTEAVRNTLGDLLRTNDKGTSITGVPALSGSGTEQSPYDFGSISTANLASVLGVARLGHNYTNIDDCNNAIDGWNNIYRGRNMPSGYDQTYSFWIYSNTFIDSQCILQLGFGLMAVSMYIRTWQDNRWSSWQTLH